MAAIYLHLNGEQKGPFAPEQVRAMLASGEIAPATLAWREGLSQWTHVAALLGAAPGALPPLPPVVHGKGLPGWAIALLVVAGVLVLSVPCCCGIALGPITNGIKKAKENMAMQQARAISLAMRAYANEHNGNYPDAGDAPASNLTFTMGSTPGATTSTEVFQKLLDGKYVTDPAIFYIAMPGKVRPVGNRLASNNVCFDVTAGLKADSPGTVPLVYSTGYDVDYSRGGIIMPSTSGPASPFTGMAVAYRNNRARFFSLTRATTTIQLLPPGSESDGQTYRQLKP